MITNNRASNEVIEMKSTTSKRLWQPFYYAISLLICSCASTNVKQTWKAPDYQGPVGKIAVITIAEKGLLRKGFENRFVEQLTAKGAAAVPTFDTLSLVEIKQDKPAAVARFRSAGAQALLVVRLISRNSSYHEIQPGRERYAAVVTGYNTVGWYDYYDLAFTRMNATYGSVKDRIYVETSLFDLKSEKRVWASISETVLSEDMDRVAEMDPLVAKIVASMESDGVVK